MENSVSLLILAAIVFIIWVFDRKNFEQKGLLFLRRTKRGLAFIDSLGSNHKRFFAIFADIGIVLSLGASGLWYILKEKGSRSSRKYALFGFALFLTVSYFIFSGIVPLVISAFGLSGTMFYYLLSSAISILTEPKVMAPMQLVLPIKVEGAPIFYVPVTYWLISIFLLVVAHEFAHAIVARAEGVRVKSLGYGFLAVLPLGFAEPDEKEMKRKKSLTRSRIFGAGSFSNIIFAGLCFLLATISVIAVSFFYTADPGLKYNGLMNNTYSAGAIPESGVITNVNNKSINSVNDLTSAMNGIKGNESISIVVDNSTYSLKTMAVTEKLVVEPSLFDAVKSKSSGQKCDVENKSGERVYIGITNITSNVEIRSDAPGYISYLLENVFPLFLNLLSWLFMLNLGIGLANLLPLKPLDGGLMAEELVNATGIKKQGEIVIFLSSVTLFIIVFTILGPYIANAAVKSLCGI